MSMIGDIHAVRDTAPSDDEGLVALNAVAVTVDQLAAARTILGQLAQEVRWDSQARHEALRTFLSDEAIATAIDQRLLALRKWEDVHDSERVLDQTALMDAAAFATLVETEYGIGFDGPGFGELVDFIAELPWRA